MLVDRRSFLRGLGALLGTGALAQACTPDPLPAENVTATLQAIRKCELCDDARTTVHFCAAHSEPHGYVYSGVTANGTINGMNFDYCTLDGRRFEGMVISADDMKGVIVAYAHATGAPILQRPDKQAWDGELNHEAHYFGQVRVFFKKSTPTKFGNYAQIARVESTWGKTPEPRT